MKPMRPPPVPDGGGPGPPLVGSELVGPGWWQRYTLLEEVEPHGGAPHWGSTVYRALQSHSGQLFTVKVIQPPPSREDGAGEDFFAQEVAMLTAARNKSCPYVVKLEDSFVDADSQHGCVVTGLVVPGKGGDSLSSHLLSGYTYKLSDVIRWGRQLAIGLEALQQAATPCGDMHLELGVQDVLLSALGDAVISNSSLRIKERQSGESIGQPPGPDGCNVIGGVWSLGACLYLLATKQGLQDEDGRAQALQQVMSCHGRDLEAFMEQALGQAWGTGPEAGLGAGLGSRARRALARVLAGTMRSGTDGRMPAQLIAETLGKAIRSSPPESKMRYNRQLRDQLIHRPNMLGEALMRGQDHHTRADLVPLVLLPNHEFTKAIERDVGYAFQRKRRRPARRPVTLDEIARGHVASKGLSLIVGPPGSGKSTLLSDLALRLVEEGEELTAVVHAHELLHHCLQAGGPKGDPDFSSPVTAVACLAAAVDPHLTSYHYPMMDDLVALVTSPTSGGSLITLLIDGLDEIVGGRMELLDCVNKMQTQGPGDLFHRVLICCRPRSVDSLDIDAACVESIVHLMPLDAKQSCGLVDFLLDQQGGIQDKGRVVKEVKEAALRHPHGSPLLINLMCWLAKEKPGAGVVTSEVQLYEAAVEQIIHRHYSNAAGPQPHEWKHVMELPSIIAYIMHNLAYQSSSSLVEKERVRCILENVLWWTPAGEDWRNRNFPRGIEGEKLLSEAFEGFMRALCYHHEGRWCMFLHRSLQDFLAARFLSLDGSRYKNHRVAALWDVLVSGDQPGAGGLAPFRWSDARFISGEEWSEVYRFAGLLRGPAWLGERMLEGGRPASMEGWLAGVKAEGLDRQDAWLRRLCHVMRACCGFVDVPPGLVQAVLSALLSVMCRTPGLFEALIQRDWLRTHEWRALPDKALTMYLECILASSLSPDALRRHASIEAFRALGDMGWDREGLVHMPIKLLRDATWDVRSSASAALYNIGDALGRLPGGLHTLVELLRDEDPEMRSHAAYALEGILQHSSMAGANAVFPGTREAVKALVALLADPEEGVRSTAVEALGSALDKQACLPVVPGLVDAIRDRLADDEAQVRLSALNVLCPRGEVPVELLIDLLGDRDCEVCARAVAAMGGECHDALCDSSAGSVVLEALQKLLVHESYVVRASAEEALKMLEPLSGREEGALLSLLPPPPVLGGRGVSTSSRESSFLRDADMGLGPELRNTARTIPDFVECIIGDVGSSDPIEASNAASVLGSLGEAAARAPGAVESLVGILGSYHGDVRDSAAMALGRMGEAAAGQTNVVESLVGLLSSVDECSRWSAAAALCRMKESVACKPGCVQTLVDLLGDADADMRESAARVLHRIAACGRLLRMAPPPAAGGGGRGGDLEDDGDGSGGRREAQHSSGIIKEQEDDSSSPFSHIISDMVISRSFLYLPLGCVFLCIFLALLAFMRCFQILYLGLGGPGGEADDGL